MGEGGSNEIDLLKLICAGRGGGEMRGEMVAETSEDDGEREIDGAFVLVATVLATGQSLVSSNNLRHSFNILYIL